MSVVASLSKTAGHARNIFVQVVILVHPVGLVPATPAYKPLTTYLCGAVFLDACFWDCIHWSDLLMFHHRIVLVVYSLVFTPLCCPPEQRLPQMPRFLRSIFSMKQQAEAPTQFGCSISCCVSLCYSRVSGTTKLFFAKRRQ